MKYTYLCSCILAVTGSWARAASPAQKALQPDTSRLSHLNLTHDLIGLHKSLVEIESITGNEAAVGDWLAENLQSQGYKVDKVHFAGGGSRFNVLAYPEDSITKLLLTSHIDTVPPFYPYKHDVKNKTISGRGSVDAKASVAAQIIAVNKLLDSGDLEPDKVSLLFVVGEETGGDGMRAMSEYYHLSPQVVIFGEPTEGKLVSGHKGNLGVKITAKGKAAHSGYPWLGRSANEVLVVALAAIMELSKTLPESEKYGSTTFNLGKIEGGVAANVVAENASAVIAVRIASQTPDYIREKVKAAIYTAVQVFLTSGMEPQDVVDISFLGAGYGPVDIDHDVPGFDVITVNYGTDIPNFKQTLEGQKRYLYGPGSILVAHSDHEALTEEELWAGVDGYEKIIRHALKPRESTAGPQHLLL